MEISEKLALYLEILNCSHPIHLWKYSSDFEMLYSDFPLSRFSGDLLKEMRIEEKLREAEKEHFPYPLFLENSSGLIFIIVFDAISSPYSIYVLGPAFSGADSLSLFQERLENVPMSLSDRSFALNAVKDAPIISTNSLIQYAITLHYLVNNERISINEIYFLSTSDKDAKDTIERITSEHRGIYEGEQSFLRLIQEGNPDYAKGIQKMMRLSSGMRVKGKNSLQNAKNNTLVLLTLVSRASIAGGLNLEISYNLNDYYADRLTQCESVSEVARLSQEMLEDYVQRNRIRIKNAGISRPVKNAMDYIGLHIRENISLSELARSAGYTEYYFSRKFKEETGRSVADYIGSAKTEEAKLLLTDSSLPVQEIAEELGFGSRNHFFWTFRKYTGMSPSEYRSARKK